MKKRIVITGMGVVSPLGIGLDKNWESLAAGKSGISGITRFDTENFPITIAGEARDFKSEDFVDKKEARRFDPFVILSIAAAEMAMQCAGLTSYKFDGERAGVIIGSGIGGFESICANHEAFLNGGYKRISPFFIPGSIINMASGIVSIRYKLLGPNSSVVTACATGSHAIGDAAKLIERGDADIMLAGGSESCIYPTAIGAFANMRALTRRNDAPEKASRPFDKDRDGFVMGEGAGVLVIESYDHAVKRNANILAEVVGYGLTSDAFHITAPDETGQGARRCMEMAVRDAGINLTDIDYINAHGTSTELNDALETKSIKELFGDHARKIHISSTKSMTGHMLGAAGAVEAIFTALALQNGVIPPTINLDTPDPACDLNYTPNKAVQAQIKYGLSNSFGFGGTNACLVLKRYEP
ncbi:MAG: beta-ketoacyl-ACP synthase II [Deferribacteraceae bacterium]|nr:beta-ketoacyl-ACP synthase II [Deferribacteraceae bacterium]